MRNLQSTCFGSWKTLLYAPAIALAAFPGLLNAQTEVESASTTTSTISIQYASEVSAGNLITLTRTPVISASGSITYWDISIPVSLGSTGIPTVVAGATTATPSLSLPVGPIEPGTYVAEVSGYDFGILITGPGIDVGGSTYTAQFAPGYSTGSPGQSVFWSGSLSNNPYISPARFAHAKIVEPTGWTFGVVSVNGSGDWVAGDIIGFKMVDNGLLIGDFTEGGSQANDQNTPYHTFLYNYSK